MIILDIMVKMGDVLHIWKRSEDFLSLFDIRTWCNVELSSKNIFSVTQSYIPVFSRNLTSQSFHATLHPRPRHLLQHTQCAQKSRWVWFINMMQI